MLNHWRNIGKKEILYRLLPLNLFLKIKYRYVFGRNLNFNNPISFSEKMYCLKIINGKEKVELIKKCYDKYTVRGYIKEKLGESWGSNVLNDLYGVYDSVNQINFDNLPHQFVIKVTQSSGYNIICPDKTKLDIEDSKRKLNDWMDKSHKQVFMEENYVYSGDIKLVCERFLQNDNGLIPPDIRVYCFNGKAKLIVVDFGTTESDGRHGSNIVRNVYDIDWNLLNVDLGRQHNPSYVMEKPHNLGDIIKIAEKLSEDFYFLRVDLYNVNGKEIKFGEMTWIPMGGDCVIKPIEYDYELGKWLTIPKLG